MLAVLSTSAHELLFLPGDPPRVGRFAWWSPPGAPSLAHADEEVEVVVPTTRSVRRRRVPVLITPLAGLLDELAGLPMEATVSASMRAWAGVVRFAVDLIARGALHPGMTTTGVDAWRAGPLDRAARAHVAALAAALPPAAHALAIPGSSPVCVRSPEALATEALDAVADAMVRTAAAARFAGARPWATGQPTDVRAHAAWLAQAVAPPDGAARTGLRLELPDGPDGDFVVRLQLHSAADPSLVIDADELWAAPGPVLARMGEHAESEMLLALRRGARAWPALGRLLEQPRPCELALLDDEAHELLGDAALALADTGLDVLWPAELGERPAVRAVIGTPTPAPVTVAGLSLDRLLEFRWQVTVGGQVLDPDEVAALAEAKRPLVRVRGMWILADAELLERLRRRPAVHGRDALAAALDGTVTIDGELLPATVEGPIAKLAERLTAVTSVRDLKEPVGLQATLRAYQRRGLAWLAEMDALGLGGCLADDMGLGKTIQLLAHHLHACSNGAAGPLLVVCPATLLANWEREARRFAPATPVRRYHGSERTLEGLAPDEIVLATYGIARGDAEQLAEIPWRCVAADEAQAIKNPLSRTARALRSIPAPTRFALTGTPVENRLTELWALLDWTTPGLLGPLESFRRTVAIPIERDRDADATARLARLVRPFVLRRRKSDPEIAPDLPPKTELDRVVPLTEEQATLYEALVRETLSEIAEVEGIARSGLVFKLLTALKQICNHPAHYLRQSGPLGGRSGKLAALDELLEIVVAEGDAALVFTQYTQMGKLLERHLASAGIASGFLHGRLSLGARQRLVDRFQAGDPTVLIVSLKAGGTGLNLTRATHVVHYDRWWNPAVEDQASDRAWRIGQDRPVTVHRLVTEGTVEDRVAALLASKRALADAVVNAGEGWITELSDAELAELVTLDSRVAA